MPEGSRQSRAPGLPADGPPGAASSGGFSMIGFGACDFAVNLGVNLASIYLLYYFTDVFAIGAAAAGSILLFGRLGLSFFDPMVGIWSERTRTRWGGRRPFLLFGAMPLAFFTFALFASPAIAAPWRTLYAFISFTLFFLNLTL